MASSRSPHRVHRPKFSFPEAMPIFLSSGATRNMWENQVADTISAEAPAALKSSQYSWAAQQRRLQQIGSKGTGRRAHATVLQIEQRMLCDLPHRCLAHIETG
eukprot:6204609-Pleurochrysis_carterae.AAC.1